LTNENNAHLMHVMYKFFFHISFQYWHMISIFSGFFCLFVWFQKKKKKFNYYTPVKKIKRNLFIPFKLSLNHFINRFNLTYNCFSISHLADQAKGILWCPIWEQNCFICLYTLLPVLGSEPFKYGSTDCDIGPCRTFSIFTYRYISECRRITENSPCKKYKKYHNEY
jgi:hypothetical protein